MEKVTGIKSVDFKITAKGHGVVNWNGSTKVKIWDAQKNSYRDVGNHNMPKFRGYSNIAGYWDDGNPQYKQANQIDFEKTPLYISQNCIRHHLFRQESYNLNSPKLATDTVELLCSITGLVRGYVLPKVKGEPKRTSPLLLTDFVDQLNNGNYEQMGRSGSKEKEENKAGAEKSNSMFSKTTFGDTEYVAYGSISIEQLQFIPLCADFGREAMVINNHSEGRAIAQRLTEYLSDLTGNEDAQATYHENYVRRGSIYDEGEQGILLNDAAIDALIQETIALLENLSIRQGKGYMYVCDVDIDYNDGSAREMMRIRDPRKSTITEKTEPYATYYSGV